MLELKTVAAWDSSLSPSTWLQTTDPELNYGATSERACRASAKAHRFTENIIDARCNYKFGGFSSSMIKSLGFLLFTLATKSALIALFSPCVSNTVLRFHDTKSSLLVWRQSCVSFDVHALSRRISVRTTTRINA